MIWSSGLSPLIALFPTACRGPHVAPPGCATGCVRHNAGRSQCRAPPGHHRSLGCTMPLDCGNPPRDQIPSACSPPAAGDHLIRAADCQRIISLPLALQNPHCSSCMRARFCLHSMMGIAVTAHVACSWMPIGTMCCMTPMRRICQHVHAHVGCQPSAGM